MKNIKKLLSIVMVLTLVLALGAQAFATEVTIEDNDVGSTYYALKLIDATPSGENLYSYKIVDGYQELLKNALGLEGEQTDTAIVAAIAGLTGNADAIRAFADKVFERLSADQKAGATKSDDQKKFDLSNGYFLVWEQLDDDAEGTAVTRVLLNTIGAEDKLNLKVKEDVPTSEKKVQDVNDSDSSVNAAGNWQDSADYDIGDSVPFKLTATIPAGTTVPYTAYALTFSDSMDAGLTFNNDVKVYLNDSEEVLDSSYYTVTPTANGFSVAFANVKNVPGFTEEAQNVFTVRYTAVLNENAVIGNPGNPNTMHIEYSNNPYESGTGKTPDDTVRVFTYTVDVDKVDGADKALAGAGFTLLKRVEGESATVGEQTYEGYKQIGTEKMVQGVDAEGKPTDVAENIVKYTVDFKGLDDGVYKLVESTVPANYNKAPDTDFTVSATHTEDDKGSNEQEMTELTGSPFTRTADSGNLNGHLNGKVVNLTGLELPSTGGIGTTIFYVVGGILVAAAVILLVTKRRVSGTEK